MRLLLRKEIASSDECPLRSSPPFPHLRYHVPYYMLVARDLDQRRQDLVSAGGGVSSYTQLLILSSAFQPAKSSTQTQRGAVIARLCTVLLAQSAFREGMKATPELYS